MNIKHAAIRIMAMAAAGAIWATSAHAVVINEIGDASNLASGAQIVPGGTDQIFGEITTNDNGDLYRIVFGSAGNVTFTGIALSGGLDVNLLLFNGVGNPIFGSDDDFSGLDEQFTLNLAAGEYLIGIGDNQTQGFDAANNLILDDDDEEFPENPSGILFDIRNPNNPSTGEYRIDFSVPEPGTLPIFGLGLAGLAFARRKRMI